MNDSEDNQDATQSLLDFIINSKRNPTEREVRPLAQQLARTLSHLHAHGVIHRNLKMENIYVRVKTTDAPFSASCIPSSRSWWHHQRHPWQAILTDFTYVVVAAPSSAVTTGSPTLPLVARASGQWSPAPELLRVCAPPALAADSQPGVDAQHAQVPYDGPPVDVWGLGVVLFTLVCGRVPFDAPTLNVLHELPLRSPETLSFPKRVSRDCRDLLRRMLQADPAARASLDEVLGHPWMKPAFGCPDAASVGADVPKHAALRWPDRVDRRTFHTIAALESKNGDDAWQDLDDALKLLSPLYEVCADPRGPFPKLNSVSKGDSLFRRAQETREFLDRVWGLAKSRSRALLDWPPILTPLGPFGDVPRKS